MRLTPETQSQIAVPCRGALRCTKTSPRVGALSAQKGKVYTFISRTLLSSGVQKLSAETETPGRQSSTFAARPTTLRLPQRMRT